MSDFSDDEDYHFPPWVLALTIIALLTVGVLVVVGAVVIMLGVIGG